jgi:hypothetical protein
MPTERDPRFDDYSSLPAELGSHAQAVIAAAQRLQKVINPGINPSPMRLNARKLNIWEQEEGKLQAVSGKSANIELPPLNWAKNNNQAKKEYFMQRAGILPGSRRDEQDASDEEMVAVENVDDTFENAGEQSRDHEVHAMNNLNTELESIVDSVA